MPCALRLSEASALAMHAMGLLAVDPGRSLSTAAIAGRFEVSSAHLSKVLQRLARIGLLRSVRGPGGGFRLASPPEEVTLLQVFEALEGPMETAHCMFSEPQCDGRTCILGEVMVDANRRLREHLASTSLADIREIFLRRPGDDPPPPGRPLPVVR